MMMMPMYPVSSILADAGHCDLRFSRSGPDLRSVREHCFEWYGAEWELNEVYEVMTIPLS